MSKPQVGDKVFYWPKSAERSFFHTQPFAATIAHVWTDTCINIAVLSDMARQFTRESVRYSGEADPEDGECGPGSFRKPPQKYKPKDGYE